MPFRVWISASLFTLTLSTWTLAAGNLFDGPDADLIYNPFTGGVWIDASDTASQKIISFFVVTENNDFRPENFTPPFPDTFTNTDRETFLIGQSDPLLEGTGPLIPMGEIFPVAIASDEESLSAYLQLAEYASTNDGTSGIVLDLKVCVTQNCDELLVVPEPSTPLLVGFAMILFALGQRRRCGRDE